MLPTIFCYQYADEVKPKYSFLNCCNKRNTAQKIDAQVIINTQVINGQLWERTEVTQKKELRQKQIQIREAKTLRSGELCWWTTEWQCQQPYYEDFGVRKNVPSQHDLLVLINVISFHTFLLFWFLYKNESHLYKTIENLTNQLIHISWQINCDIKQPQKLSITCLATITPIKDLFNQDGNF